jgi:hypothetical protein
MDRLAQYFGLIGTTGAGAGDCKLSRIIGRSSLKLGFRKLIVFDAAGVCETEPPSVI